MSNHDGHRVTYNENAICAYHVEGVRGSNVLIQLKTQMIEDLNERFLYCEDCERKVEPEELGLPEYWSADYASHP